MPPSGKYLCISQPLLTYRGLYIVFKVLIPLAELVGLSSIRCAYPLIQARNLMPHTLSLSSSPAQAHLPFICNTHEYIHVSLSTQPSSIIPGTVRPAGPDRIGAEMGQEREDLANCPVLPYRSVTPSMPFIVQKGLNFPHLPIGFWVTYVSTLDTPHETSPSPSIQNGNDILSHQTASHLRPWQANKEGYVRAIYGRLFARGLSIAGFFTGAAALLGIYIALKPSCQALLPKTNLVCTTGWRAQPTSRCNYK